MTSPMTHSFNANFREDEWQALSELAHTWRLSRADVLRKLVLAAATMQSTGKPSCATGIPCLAPQLHAQQQPQTTAWGPRHG